jgi:putative ABC transport system permease protein
MRAFKSGFVALGIVVLLAAAGVVAWPAATSALVTADARDRLAQASVASRDLTGTVPVQLVTGENGHPTSTAGLLAQQLPSALETARDHMQPALRAATRAGRFVSRADGVRSIAPAPLGLHVHPVPTDPKLSELGLSVEADPRLGEDAVLVNGRWPSGGLNGRRLDVAITATIAKRLHWKVGATRTVDLDLSAVHASPLNGEAGTADRFTLTLRLVGTVTPRNASDDFWQLDPVRSTLGVSLSPDPNSKITFYHGLVWMDADAWPQLAMALGDPYVYAWYGVTPSAVELASLPAVSAAATTVLASPIEVGGVDQPLRMTSGLPSIARSITQREGPVPTLLAIVAIGPLGAAVAVLFVGARLMTSRRARELALLRARGGSERRVRGMLALETAIVAVPAAVIGGGAAALATGLLMGAVSASSLLLIAACAVVPPCAVAVTASPERTGARRPVTALIAELFVLALAAAACVLLLQRGTSTATDPTSIDPLLVATPLLLVFAVCVLVLRVYPVVLDVVGRGARAARGAVAPVGWASATRGGAGRRWPLFAMLTGVAVAVFAGTTLVTLVTSARQDAVARVGADVTVSAPLSSASIQRLRAIDGVSVVAPLRLVGSARTKDGSNVTAYLVDPAEISAAQSGVPEAQRLLPPGPVASAAEGSGGGSGGGGPGGGSSAKGASGALTVLGGVPSSTPVTGLSFDEGRSSVPVRVVHRVSLSDAPFLTDDQWALIDGSQVPASLRAESTATGALIGVEPGADTGKIAVKAQSIAGKGAVVDSVQAEQRRQRQGPLLVGIQVLMLAGTVLALVMAVGALLLTLAMARGARIRLLAVLRTLGFDRSQSAALVAWEVVPLAVTAIGAGVLTGIGLAWLMVSAVDLRSVTGALARPQLVLSPGVIGLVVALFALGTAVALVFAVAAARRADPARTLRAAEEEL